MGTKLVVNLFGAPNSGKTVRATSLFSKLKQRHIDTVLVNEFAHEKVVEENKVSLSNQLYVWANQQYKIFCGYRHARVVVTDSPILLGMVYNTRPTTFLDEVILEEHRAYNNLNIMLELDPSYPYSMVGRIHSLVESQSIQNRIVATLTDYEIPFIYFNETTEDDIVNLIESTLDD